MTDKELRSKLLKRVQSNIAHAQTSSAPFHIPHRSCLKRKLNKAAVTDEINIIHDLSLKEENSAEPIKPKEIRAKPIIKKHAEFMLSINSVESLKSNQRKEVVKKSIIQNKLMVKKSPPIEIDLNELIENKIQKFKDNRFIYLTYMVDKKNEYFTPYSLSEVPYKLVDRSNFYTISRHGVTYFSRTENHFTKLIEWQTEYQKFQKLKKLKTFRVYRIWKNFKVWQKTVQWKKYKDRQKFLQDNLFIVSPILAKTILHLRNYYHQLTCLSFVDITAQENQHLFYFIEAQMLTYETARDALIEYRLDMQTLLFETCKNAIIERGFHPIDEALIYTTLKKLREMMSSTDRANKRRFCILLTKFLGYCDFMTITILHEMYYNTYAQLSKLFRQHDAYRPTYEQLTSNTARDVQLELKRENGFPQLPLFNGELVLTPNRIIVDPSKEITLKTIHQICDLIDESVFDMKRFQSDDTYLLFTKPCIMGRQEDRLSGKTPDINFVFNNDKILQENRKYIFECIETAYDTVDIYVQRFEPIRQNYEIDTKTNPSIIKNERSAVRLREYCYRYSDEITNLENILPTIRLGLLHLKQDTFKINVTPICQNLMSILNSHIPKIAMDLVNEQTDKAQAIIAKLCTQPDNTMDCVNFMRYFNECQIQVNQLIEDVEFAFECFTLMKDYNIEVGEVEKENFMDCEDLILQSKEILEAKIAMKPVFVDKLDETIQQNMKELFKEVEDIRIETLNELLTDEKSETKKVKETIQLLVERLTTARELANELRDYQREFKIKVSRIDVLEEVQKELNIRQILWNSRDEWTTNITKWNEQSFNQLDVEVLTDTVLALIKNCAVLDKGLPENRIVQKLRYEIEEFRDKLPCINYLRNPALKPRHWIQIENILNRKLFQDDKITLSVYEEVNAFTDPNIVNELMEVSGQASTEKSLDTLLKKVEFLWKELELSIVPHHDSKDVFILAGLDELQLALDESNININTLAASRHVGPIKERVDEWKKQLDFFNNTMEEWVTCQTSWIYLEAIFSAPDIQRQLPTEARMFMVVDKNWKDLMRKTFKMPLALPAMTDEKTYATMKHNNELLDKIIKCLEAYLEVKRVAFPRFYFLSNDELLEILAQTKNPHAVQAHLRKCFDAIAKLQFGTKEEASGDGSGTTVTIMTNDIVAMISPEGEKVLFGLGLKARGPVEDWLSKVEEAMCIALKRCMKFGYKCYPTKDRSEWFQDHSNQVVLTISQQQWAADVHGILEQPNEELNRKKMMQFEQSLVKNLSKLAEIARSDISKLLRKVLCALITIDVHARDMISGMVKAKVSNVNDFNWLKMLRYYWIQISETIQTKMSSSSLPYFYEYLGAGGVLVITPLTDRCYLCLMGALQMDLGGAPAGPAGTGKTETTKDLAKALAKLCVVFNCSEGLDYKMMGRFFSGLAQSGAWCCFDEFNRIDIEVLSVIAQQLITIGNAKAARLNRFLFEGREIKLNMSCAAFITMNPGYAGRTELPDNLKALFRPMSMMVPDYALIAEVILYSEGFESSKILANKMVQMYKLCSEQLSQQDHYDFGMRAVKSVLVMAGALKRASPNQSEDITLISALRDSNLPKFLSDDAILFKGILGDLFPGIALPIADYGALFDSIVYCLEEKNLQPIPEMIAKCIQLYETMCVRWGVMLVGPTGGGKSSVLYTLGRALSKLFKDGCDGPNYRHVNTNTLNPKAISSDELYGWVNLSTLEWKDGLLGILVRTAVNITAEEHQWIVCDGPVDAVWIENLNTVLDDNKMLCLANSERIKLTAWIHMVFEVQDLSQASPATVSRCGMVYVDPGELGWQPLFTSWQQTISDKQISKDLMEFLQLQLNCYLPNFLKYAKNIGIYSIHQVEATKVSMICTLLSALTKQTPDINKIPLDEGKNFIFKMFIWALLWSVGGNFDDESKIKLEIKLRKLIKSDNSLSILENLPTENLWNLKLNLINQKWELWSDVVQEFKYDPEVRFFDILVPTADTTKFGYVAELLFREKFAVMFTGDSGVGKSVLTKSILQSLVESDVLPVFLNFSAQTSSICTQEMIEARLEKRKKTLLGAPTGKSIIFFVDDVNMPKLDTYGSQPPIELLRQFLDFKGFYDRDKNYWKNIADCIFGCACAPPGGGRNSLTPRFVRHFALLLLPPPQSEALTTIFSAILNGFLADFEPTIKSLVNSIVDASVSIYTRISQELLPTPTKSHYIFNLRDLSKCVQGILQADSSSYSTPQQILRLFYHESMRVFHDRLINDQDKIYFLNLMEETSIKYFNGPIVKTGELIIFGDFMRMGLAKEDRIYEEITDFEQLKNILTDYIEDYAMTTGKEMPLILFRDAVEHVTRLARLLRSERSNGLMIGLNGMGKQSLCKLASHINGYKCTSIVLSRGYDISKFNEDLRNLYKMAGAQNQPTVFLLTDTQIVQEEFLENINNILNSGEVPNLFEGDDFEQVILACTDEVAKLKLPDQSRDGIFQFFINRVRANLHIVLSMSPVGDAFRRRCRMFPSLVNCCTIDWYVKWPTEALYSVAIGSLASISDNQEENEKLATICVKMHESVEVASEQLYDEFRRHYYTTPNTYLELLKLYKLLLKKRSDSIIAQRSRLSKGLSKILDTNELILTMQNELSLLAPELEIQSAEMAIMLEKLAEENKTADAFKARVMEDEAQAMEKAVIARGISDDANRDLAVTQPTLDAAQDALKAINKNDINELRTFAQPPQMVQFVMESVCILFKTKPSWDISKKLMSDGNFLKKLIEFDKEHINDATLKKLKVYLDNPDFEPTKIEKVSKVAKSVSLWVIAMDQFAKIYKVVEPKIKKAREAEAELNEIMAVLKQKQAELAEIEAQIQKLKDNIDNKNREFQIIQDDVDLTTARLNRAGRLTSALSDEEIRWGELIENFTNELWAIPGDVLVASAYVAYIAVFPAAYRRKLTSNWIKTCHSLQIPSGTDFNLVNVFGDSYQIRNWNMCYLPRDEISIENGIVVTKALRWPLMIDPQEQANRWIRCLESENHLCITKLTDQHLMRYLEVCIRQGYPCLIEELEETLDPALQPILTRSQYISAGRLLIKLGDTEVDYDENFRLYMTTKLSNPHYLPEVCTQVTLVNFLVTVDGLEDQLLADVVAIELPEMEKQRSDLIVRINADKQQLLQLEDKVLKLLFNATGNILDDEELVETLTEAKETSAIIANRMIDTEKTEAVITETRERYRLLSARGAILFFVVASLAETDPMYQYSLKYFKVIFCSVISAPHEKMDLPQRLSTLITDEVYAIYRNVSRGLFEKHKLIFSFLLSTAVEQHENRLTKEEFDFFLRGPIGTWTDFKIKPNEILLSEYSWKCCLYLELHFNEFKNLTNDLDKKLDINLGEINEQLIFTNTKDSESTKKWNSLKPFHKIMLINSVAPQKSVLFITAFINETLGKRFTNSASNNSLSDLYADTTNVVPLIFILSTGSDPMASFLRFVQELNLMEKFHSISLGQGQGPAAEELIKKGRTLGHWIFLQNCHLATSWMPQMEVILKNIALGELKVHEDFRLYLSSMPSQQFPVSVLQNSVKVTNEPPKGLKATLIRAFQDMNKDFFEKHALTQNWRAMVFGLSIFHGVLLERRKFGPLGWNITYEFTESDRQCGLRTLDMYCDRENSMQPIPWDALEYINGEITWGGRVTDYWDQRCLKTILKVFHSERILHPQYKYTENGVYKCPDNDKLDIFQEYANNLPFIDQVEIFGMHENANMVYQTKETTFFISTVLEGQPRQTGAVGGASSSDNIVLDIIENISKAFALKINQEHQCADLMKLDSQGRVPSLTTVLMQETDRYDKLLKIVSENLIMLNKAIKGFVVMSESLEAIFISLFNNQIPQIWSTKGFLSTKSLGYWILDFQYRIDYIQTWMNQGLPYSSWLSGLYFPQSFLTGMLQTYARKHNIPIDTLIIDFEIMPQTIYQSEIYHEHQNNVKESSNLYKGIQYPNDGIIIHGLFIDGGRWDESAGGLSDSLPGQLVSPLPAVWVKPCTSLVKGDRYEAPLYKTQVRAGVLSTTGHSTNYVVALFLKSKKSPDFWILRGTALVTAVTE